MQSEGLTSEVFFISVASSIVYRPEELIHSKLVMTLFVLYRTQTLLLCYIQINPAHTPPPSYFFKIHVNVLIFHLCLGLPIYFFRLPHQNPVCLSFLLFYTVILHDFMFAGEYNLKYPIMQISCFFLLLLFPSQN